jgi:hypothetical protein
MAAVVAGSVGSAERGRKPKTHDEWLTNCQEGFVAPTLRRLGGWKLPSLPPRPGLCADHQSGGASASPPNILDHIRYLRTLYSIGQLRPWNSIRRTPPHRKACKPVQRGRGSNTDVRDRRQKQGWNWCELGGAWPLPSRPSTHWGSTQTIPSTACAAYGEPFRTAARGLLITYQEPEKT